MARGDIAFGGKFKFWKVTDICRYTDSEEKFEFPAVIDEQRARAWKLSRKMAREST